MRLIEVVASIVHNTRVRYLRIRVRIPIERVVELAAESKREIKVENKD